jgi:hypothetical protein
MGCIEELPERQEDQRNVEMEHRVLRSKLINLSLDWELAAMALDAQRHKAQATEKQAFRETATVYRKCIAELSEILGTRNRD